MWVADYVARDLTMVVSRAVADSASMRCVDGPEQYYNRYSNHEQSAKLEKETYARIERRMEEIQFASSLSWIEVQFLKKAVDVCVGLPLACLLTSGERDDVSDEAGFFSMRLLGSLGECRATLKWTYAMAYYLEKNNQTHLFEDNQADLEMATENLSELLEAPIEAETIPELRAKTQDKSVYVMKRHEILLKDTCVDARV